MVDVADFWLAPLIKKYKNRNEAKSQQEKMADEFCNYMNFDNDWVCPIGLDGCVTNCGSYGCGN